jgi:hypothetical protein
MRIIVNAQTGEVTQDADFTPTDCTEAVVPDEISKVQFVRAARAAGLWDTHKVAIEAHEDWPYVVAIPRNDPIVLAMAQGLGFTDEQLDAIWIAGAAL